MNKKLKIAIGLIISISLIIYLFYNIEFNSVKNALLTFNRNVLIILALIYVVGIVLRSIRWQLLIKQRKTIVGVLIFKALVIGYMVNNLLPAKVGELARVEYLKQKENIGRSYLLGSVFIERLLDIIIVIIIFVSSLLFSKTSKEVFSYNQWIIYLLAGVIILFVYFMLKPQIIKWFIKFLPNKQKKRFEQIVSSFTKAINFINNKRLLSGISFLSILIWGLTLLSVYLILWGLKVTLPFYAYFFVIAAGVLGVIIPSTSGGIGVYHAISTGALLLFNVVPEKALAYSIIAHAFDFFPNIVLGLGILFNESINFNKVVGK